MKSQMIAKSAVLLLAEDNPADTDLISVAFEDAEEFTKNYVVKVVENGVEVIDYLRRRGKFASPKSSPRPDVIFMDINLPLMSGKQALHEIKNDLFFQSIPVIMVTTSNSKRDIVESYNLGANAYITKPADVDDFIWMIQTTAFYWTAMVQLPPTKDYSSEIVPT